MDFSLNDQQTAIQREIGELAAQLADPQLQQRDLAGEFSRPLWQVLHRHRFDTLFIERERGGRGYGAFDASLALEALGRHCQDSGLIFGLAAHLCACLQPLLKHGSPAQLDRWLPRIQQGLIGAHAITEPEAGSDVFAMQTRAVREGAGYVINGSKCYITNAPVADFLLVHARTGPGHRYFDFSTFILAANTPGVSISPVPHEKLGLRTAAMGDIRFEHVWVPEQDRIGAEGSGGPIFQVSMDWERTCLFALYLGVMQRQLALCVARSESRHQFGQAIAGYQAVSHKLVDMSLRLESARLALYKSAWQLDQGKPDNGAAAMAKLLVSDACVQNSLAAVQIHAAQGILSGEIERQLRNAMPAQVFSGTSEVLKNNLARQLRLAAAYRQDKDE
ncbi:acyl-CoA dehydrogenase [Chitinimonas arctica]|uniref:Acyl-CoA dehydrogenase n=1 Tax=Chitinimonas arctica TaxID=2594795 RepID=A0A516SCU8_9NEIS|nr:acyl-CoA dehydrogenase family protein [Chitinimonas arctica]QDQ25964.1 acyl-CoA dehydrogenase [Chitinimonas arctica]